MQSKRKVHFPLFLLFFEGGSLANLASTRREALLDDQRVLWTLAERSRREHDGN